MESPPAPAILSYVDPGDGRRLAVRHRKAPPGQATVVFLPGYASDMEGAKATAIDDHAGRRGIGCLRMDYSGTGSSGGDFADGTLDRWLDEVVALLDLLVTDDPVIVAGSSMGGWLALHLALRRPHRVGGILGIAAAADFTDWGITAEAREAMIQTRTYSTPSADGGPPRVIHRDFWQSGIPLRLLGGPIDVECPVRLVNGDADPEVPVGVPFKLVELLRSSDVQLRLIKGSGHRLSDPHEIAAILGELDQLLEIAR